ncbi:MAG: ADP-glyceromanno-heptose 6-epimerase [Clostridia bacterium]|nr:ADP-glyceromanno-heptose 6-epimerase [Clostridia bacterium]
MKIAVTGGAGFIGSVFLWKLNMQGIKDIIVVDVGYKAKDSANIKGKNITAYIERDDFRRLIGTGRMDDAIDVIVHLGACADTTQTDSKYLDHNNFLYTKELALWSIKNNKPFYYASSAATYGSGELGYSDDDSSTLKLQPLNEYGRSKHKFDLWVLDNKIADRVVGFKFFNVYGPNEYHKQDMRSMINKGYYQIKETGRLKLFKSYKPEYADGGQMRDFVYVKDVVDIMWFFLSNPGKRGIYNVGTGRAYTWNELARALFKALGKEPVIEYIDMPQNIKQQYQYFTKAVIAKLRSAGCDHSFMDMDKAVKDYAGYLGSGKYL